MSMLTINHESLTRDLGREVPEIYVVIAKHSVLGMDDDGIKEVIGCTSEELADVLNDPLYREVRLVIGTVQAQTAVNQTEGWDHLETFALKNLAKRVEVSQDPDFLLRVAAVANKAQRRASAGKEQGILDPANGRRTTISLTTRLVQTLQGPAWEETRTLSIEDGSMKNPSFDEVNGLLSVHATPALPRNLEIKTATPEVDFDELDRAMKERGS